MAKARRSRGDGALYQRASDGRWCASVDLGWNPNGTRKRKVVSGRTQAEALEKLRALRRQVETHGRAIPTAGTTVSAWLSVWLDQIMTPRVKPKTLDGYRHKAALIDQAIGKVRLDALTPAHVRQMHQHAAAGRSPMTALHCHRLLSQALSAAVREGVAVRNVAQLVDAPEVARTHDRPLTAAEGRHVLATASVDPMYARWLLALMFGVRQGEALGLTWDCVDYNAGTLELAWQLQRYTWRHGCARPCGARRGADCPDRHLGIPPKYEHRVLEGAWVLTRPKREKARVVDLHPLMEAALRQRQDITAAWPNPHDLVFARPDGHPYDPALDNRAWHDLLAAAGMPPARLHSARHTSATVLQSLGVEESVRMAILGHSTASVQRQYAQVDLATQRQALDRIAAALTAG